jgi:hypothetical protein
MMRIISFSKKWGKLNQLEFTTFRVPRKDAYKGRDWQVGEEVQVYFHNRQPDREFLGFARIIKKESMLVCMIDDEQAVEDGFTNASEMFEWLEAAHHKRIDPHTFRINKLTLKRS